MSNIDFTPLFRTAIGFDRLPRMFEKNQALNGSSNGFPPYNIEKTGEDSYRLSMAVAGFAPENLEITTVENMLVIKGNLEKGEQTNPVLYRGIAGRGFERKFLLADHIVVEEAQLEYGLLHVNIKRVVPESAKPKNIPITGKAPVSNELHLEKAASE